jgi:hypothetical protein
MCFSLLGQEQLWDIEFTDEQRGRILGAVFEIVEMMNELDKYNSILVEGGLTMQHPAAADIEFGGIAFIISDFEEDEQEEIIRMVNDQQGHEEGIEEWT